MFRSKRPSSAPKNSWNHHFQSFFLESTAFRRARFREFLFDPQAFPEDFWHLTGSSHVWKELTPPSRAPTNIQHHTTVCGKTSRPILTNRPLKVATITHIFEQQIRCTQVPIGISWGFWSCSIMIVSNKSMLMELCWARQCSQFSRSQQKRQMQNHPQVDHCQWFYLRIVLISSWSQVNLSFFQTTQNLQLKLDSLEHCVEHLACRSFLHSLDSSS